MSKRDVVVVQGSEETSGVYELGEEEITKVECMLDVVRIRARAACEPGLIKLVQGQRLSADKEARKLVAYGEVLGMLARGDLRDADLFAIKHDWADALSSAGGWQRGH